MEFVCITVDCHHPERIARFWNEALHWGGVRVSAGGDSAICRPTEAGTYLEFVRVPEHKTIKNRLHLGLNAGTLAEIDDEIERLAAAGASIAWEEEFSPDIAQVYRNVILRDPEGNEFCLAGGSFPR